MRFEIDISGSDIFDPDYVICISSKELFNGRRIIKGFKIDEELIKTLIKKWKGNKYRYYYDQYEQTRGTFKVRIYCIIIYYLFKRKRNPLPLGSGELNKTFSILFY